VDDELTAYLEDDLEGSYDCVDRLVVNAYNPLCQRPAGFRYWWRRLMGGSDTELDNAHLMRLAGRFSRRVRAWAKGHGIPVIDCQRGERKHEMAEEYLASHPVTPGVFLILVARAVAMVYEVERTAQGVVRNIERKKAYVNHYSFHILDPEWGHLTIKMSGHPPFDAQIMLNGHEWVERQAGKAGLGFVKEGNCFTSISNAASLGMVADTLSESRTVGHLIQICERWIYSACLCFGLDRQEQEQSGFCYAYSVFQLEYSHNLLFREGAQMDGFFQALVGRAWGRLDLPQLKTLFGSSSRPWSPRSKPHPPRRDIVLERPSYDLTVFKLHYGYVTLKVYTKGERVLRFEAIADHAGALRCGRIILRFPDMVFRLKRFLERFLAALHCVDRTFIPNDTLDHLPTPSRLGSVRVGGVDINAARMRAAMAAVVALGPTPRGFTVADLAAKVRTMTGRGDYGPRQAAYDIRKLRAKQLVNKLPAARRYQASSAGLRTMGALVVLREHVLKPLLTAATISSTSAHPTHWTAIDQHYEAVRTAMRSVLTDLGVAA
jgi:hypothetical protein